MKKYDTVTGIDFTLEDIINDEGVKNMSPDKRKCRFFYENHHNSMYKYYSYGGCSIDVSLTKLEFISL